MRGRPAPAPFRKRSGHLSKTLINLFAACLWLVLSVASLQAHAVLERAVPENGALLDSPPTEAVLSFNEGVKPLAITLIAPDGAASDLTAVAQGGVSMRVPLSLADRGTYVLNWRVVSEDGHPIPGAQVFSVGEVTGATDAAPAVDPVLRGLMWAARWVLTSALVVAVGGALFGALSPLPARTRRGLAFAAVIAVVAAAAYLGLHGADALGRGVAAALTAPAWSAAWMTSFGPATALAAASALVALIALRLRWLAVVAFALMALSFAMAGHASAAAPQWLMRPMVFLHVAAVTFWIGALIPLAALLTGGAQALRRFSALVPVALVVLLGSGIVLAVVQLGPDPRAWLVPYGYLLAAKLVLVAVLFAIGAANRWWWTRPALAGDPGAIRAMRRSIGVELVLAAAILGLIAGWRFTPPPRALALVATATPATPEAFLHIHEADVMSSVLAKPGSPGPVSVEIFLNDNDMEVITPISVTMGVALPDKGIERVTYQAEPDADGIWHIPQVMLPLPGNWQVDLDIRVTRFKLVKQAGVLEIK